MIRSLRGHLLLAASLWTFGLLGFTHVFFLFLARMFPGSIRIHLHSLVIVALLCMIGGLLQLRKALQRFHDLRDQLGAVREGRSSRVDGVFPTEVQPLVNDLNALLENREQAIKRALAKAGDLAHGLKTPLAVIAHEAGRVDDDAADAIRQQIDRMQRQIDFHLAHARAAGSGATLGARSSIAESVDGLVRTLQRLHAERRMTFDARVPPAHAARVQREDLDEMLGNLLDNACKWGRSRITIGSMLNDSRVTITVDDDGAGLDAALRETVLQRGVRADEAAPGSGLGLAIVRDLAEVYGGSIALEASPLGGVSARLQLPAATANEER